jgi:BlaI family penicillinase repressor
MKAPNISEAEWTVMEILWQSSPRTSGEVVKALSDSTGWAANTVRTLLTRLVDKGALKIKETSEGRVFLPAVKREMCVKAESEDFLQRVFQGAAKPLLLHFAANAELTADEVKELKRLLDESIKSQPK